MTAIGSGLPATPSIPPREEARRGTGSAPPAGAGGTTVAGMSAIQAQAAQRFVAAPTQADTAGGEEIDRDKLAMLPERFWPYEIWLKERGWTRENAETPEKTADADGGEASGRAYRESAQRAAEAQRAELEAALARRRQEIPEDVVAAVKLVGALRDDKGSPTGLAFAIDRRQREARDGETPDDPASRLFAAHGEPKTGLIATGDDGRPRLAGFALKGLPGGHEVRHEARSGAVTLRRGGRDVTAAAIKGDRID